MNADESSRRSSIGAGSRPPQRWAVSGRRPRDESAQQERLESFHRELIDQVLALADGSDGSAWKSWLSVAARFHHYSFNNTVSIMMQRPDATRVAGYQAWQSLGRQVRQGEQGIKILAPVTRRSIVNGGPEAESKGPASAITTAAAAAATPASARSARSAPSVLPGPGSPTGQHPSAPRRIVGVRIAFVFDISQTDPIPGAPPLPEPPPQPHLLTGQAPLGLWDGLARQVDEAGFTLTMADPGGGARGRTNHLTRQVEVCPDLEPAQQVRTLAHELGHVLLHDPAQLPVEQLRQLGVRGRVELEAESVAYLVTAASELDSSSYTFAYVSGWVPDRDTLETTLRQTAARVLSTAHTILERLDWDNRGKPAPAAADADQPVHLDLGRGAVIVASGPDVSHGSGLAIAQMPAAPSATSPQLDWARAARRGGVPGASPYVSERVTASGVDR